MPGSSPARRRSYQFSSPQRPGLPDLLQDDRNSEARHRAILEFSKKEHDRVRSEADKVLEHHKLEQEHERILAEKRKEEERIRKEEQLAAERARVAALKVKKVPIPPPPAPDPPVQTNTKPQVALNPASSPFSNGTTTKPPAVQQPSPASLPRPAGLSQQPAVGLPFDATRAPVESKTPAVQLPPISQALKPPAAPSQTQQPAAQPVSVAGQAGSSGQLGRSNGTAVAPQGARGGPDRYREIHQSLKQLRKSLEEQKKTNPVLKEKMGDMRREIRKSVGQLTAGVGANRKQVERMTTLLREALANTTVQSQPIDPTVFVLEPRPPVEGANNGALPSLFLYLLNIFAKAVISQFVNEASARPDTANPVGIVTVALFSEPTFCWRGKSMIDILIAKFRVSCPVLFGYRGSENTEQGRQRLGWKNDGGGWVPEQTHMDRMTGLGAGYGAIALRDFTRVKKQNPYPPTHYWEAMAGIVNTPPEEVSSTQCTVLKFMIQGYESKFIEAYGTAAVAALRVALVDFPAKIPNRSAAVTALSVLAKEIKRDYGLQLA